MIEIRIMKMSKLNDKITKYHRKIQGELKKKKENSIQNSGYKIQICDTLHLSMWCKRNTLKVTEKNSKEKCRI